MSSALRRFGPFVLVYFGLAACGDKTPIDLALSTSLVAAVATAGCGNGTVEGFEECDGAADAACPGLCSTQCACPATAPHDYLEVHMIDVGQGDSLLVWSPDGFVMLADAGTEGSESAVSAYLGGLGITDIDYTLVSHMHADHLGAMDRVLQQYNAVACFDSGRTYGSNEYSEYNAEAGSRRVTVIPSDTIDMGRGLTVDVVHGDISSADENNNSVVIRITHGSTTVMIGGDCESSCEANFDPGQIDVYKVHHHGSSGSSSDLLLSRMQASDALISCGAGNSYGHPHQAALDRLASYGVNVYRTDLDGDVVVLSNGSDFVVNGPLGCSDGATRLCGTTDAGACEYGTQTCSFGSWGPCVGEVGPVAEDCSNGIDDDCDGLTDSADSDCGGSSVDHLLIAQVGYDTPGTDSIEEFFDLFNPTGAPVTLDGWSVQDNLETWSFPAGVTIPAGRYLSVARDAAGFSALYGKEADVVGLTLALGNAGDRLILRDAGSVEVDRVAWEGYDAGWTITAPRGDAIERISLDVDTDLVSDWTVTSPADPRGGPAACSGDAECDDGAWCNGAEVCDPVLGCQAGTSVDCSSLDDPCNTGVCDEVGDRCLASPVPDGTACDNGDACAGDTCLAGACEPVACEGPSHLLIAQVGYDTPGRDSQREFVDLYNPTPSDVSLDGWSLQDNSGSWSFPPGTVIAAGTFLSVARSASGFASYYGKSAGAGGMSIQLGNSGDRVRLRDASNAEVDQCAWEGTDGWSITASSGDSIERLDLVTDSDTEADWGITSPATPRGGT